VAIVARGTVQDRPWGRTMAFVADRRFSGELVVEADGRRYVVGFDDGAVVAAASPLATDAAVRVALTAGLVSSSQVAEINRQVTSRPDLDEVDAVAAAAKLGGDQVDRLRRRVIAHKAIRGFALDRGDFVLTDERSLEFEPGHAIDVRALIFLGARTHMTEQRLLQELARIGPGFQLRPEAIPTLLQYGFGEAEKPVLAALRAAPIAVIELDSAAPELDPRTVRAVAYALAVTNALDIAQSSVAHDRPRAPTGVERSRKSSGLPASREVGSERTRKLTSRDPDSERGRAARPPGDTDFETRTPTSATRIPRSARSSDAGMSRSRAARLSADVDFETRTPSAATQIPRAGTSTSGGLGKAPSEPGFDRGRKQTAIPTALPGVDDSGAHARRPSATGSRLKSTSPPATEGASLRGKPPSTPPVAIDSKVHRRPPRRTSTQPVAPAPVATEVRALIEERRQALADGADHYALLGVAPDASQDLIRRVYFGLARQLHPDRLTALGIEDDDRSAQRLFAQINTAFGVLSSQSRRSDYGRTMEAGGEAALRAQQDQAEELTRRVLAAEEQFRIGEMALRRDQLDVALEHFRRAVQLNPDEADHHALLGWAIFVAAEDKPAVTREARGMLERAARMAAKAIAPRLYLGRMARMLGRDREAIDYFDEVLKLSPGHLEASSERRVLEQRHGHGPGAKDDGKPGLFGRRRKP